MEIDREDIFNYFTYKQVVKKRLHICVSPSWDTRKQDTIPWSQWYKELEKQLKLIITRERLAGLSG